MWCCEITCLIVQEKQKRPGMAVAVATVELVFFKEGYRNVGQMRLPFVCT